jgi:hypothetical protein
MSIADFYVHKAEQCVRLANTATDSHERTALHEEAELWRAIARDIARQDRDAARRPQSSP